jgi:hypothetical protein
MLGVVASVDISHGAENLDVEENTKVQSKNVRMVVGAVTLEVVVVY